MLHSMPHGDSVFLIFYSKNSHLHGFLLKFLLIWNSHFLYNLQCLEGGNQSKMGKDSNLSHTDDARDSFDHRKTCLGGNIVQIENEVGVFTLALILHMCDVDPLRRDDGEDLG